MSLPSLGRSTGWRTALAVALPSVLGSMWLAPILARQQEQEPMLRVLLTKAPMLELAAASGPLRVDDGTGRLVLELPPGGRMRLRMAANAIEAVVAGSDGVERLVPLPTQSLWIDPRSARDGEGVFLLDQRSFRGRLLLRPVGDELQAINQISLERYLSSVVGSEMPASWPQAALRAQAVAARTFALRQRRPKDPFDLMATVASQVYRGVAAETPSTRAAVAATRAQVLTYGNGLINAVFHSSSGGSTENSGELWSRQLPYLVSVPDYDGRSPVYRWQERFEPDQLLRAFPETGGVLRIDTLATSSSGRVRRAKVIGPSGVLDITGAELRMRLGLRSTLVSFVFQTSAVGDATLASLPLPAPQALPPLPGSDTTPGVNDAQPPLAPPLPTLLVVGRGFGHGVGMSQWGAYGMALRGQNYSQILHHYYRGAQLQTYR